MSGKYRELIKGDTAPKSALNALSRKVAKQGVLVDSLTEDKRRAREAAAARPDGQLYVTRDELLYALETGEAPAHWAPAEPGWAAEPPANPGGAE